MSRQSAVIVRIKLPVALEQLRLHNDPGASNGVPAHITLLFPFLQTDELTPAVRRQLAGIGSEVRPFDVRFDRVGRFPGVAWLAPDPPGPFVALTERLAEAFPDHPPYEGTHDHIVPHLTIGIGEEYGVRRLERTLAGCPPFGERVRAIEVIAENSSARWHRRWRIPLGRSVDARSTAPSGSRRQAARGRAPTVRR